MLCTTKVSQLIITILMENIQKWYTLTIIYEYFIYSVLYIIYICTVKLAHQSHHYLTL